MARPTKYNADTVETYLTKTDQADPIAVYLKELATGNHSHSSAAGMAGVHVDTIAEWRDRYPEFSAAEARARARAIETLSLRLKSSDKNDDWRKYAWMLEHYFGYKAGSEEGGQKAGAALEGAGNSGGA